MKAYMLTLVIAVAASVALSCISAPVRAEVVNAPAPPLTIDTWVKGDPVDLAAGKGKNVYVIEFWATWCPPCKRSIPHLTELQKRYKDKGLVVIGISDESAEEVLRFVNVYGDKMNYTVAVDKDEKTGDAFNDPFKVDSIPHTYVLDRTGRIVWQGNPLKSYITPNLEDAVKGALAGVSPASAAK